jgi:lipopolysaccharide/colanic/teichoic acid biosynthesis glycosyltransferase
MNRTADVTLAIAAGVLSLPLVVVLAVLVRWRLGAPVLFRQDRPGLDGTPFTLYKFRTMREANDAAGCPLPDSSRLTRLGRFLRSTSLDELPELWNVIRGDMSRAPPSAHGVPADLRRTPATTARGPAGTDRLGAGQRSQRGLVGRAS